MKSSSLARAAGHYAAVALLGASVGCGEETSEGAGAGNGSGAAAPGSSGSRNAGGSESAGAGAGSGVPGSAPGWHPADGGVLTVGGTMTFTDLGAAGWWPRRLDRDPSHGACTVKAGTDTWGAPCCLTEHATEDVPLAPFDKEMTLLLKAVSVRQLAVYQPRPETSDGDWALVSSWDDRDGQAHNLWSSTSGAGSASLLGDFTQEDCVYYVAQEPSFDCGDGTDYYCPDDPGVKHLGWSGSKLIVLLASMDFEDDAVKACGSDEQGHPGPWIAFVASELTRDGGRKWNGLCNCYSKTGTVGDGCGELNLFEVVMDDNAWSNREFISTGLRSFQAGHVGGNVCGEDCRREDFPADQDVVDACSGSGFEEGPLLPVGGSTQGCPVWVRPRGDRYLIALLDAATRTLQVAMLHPDALPTSLGELLPSLPVAVSRSTIDELAGLRLPAPGG